MKTYDSFDWHFERVSGAYIDVFYKSNPQLAVSCINVYDYAAGKPLKLSREEFIAKCEEWIKEQADDYERQMFDERL